MRRTQFRAKGQSGLPTPDGRTENPDTWSQAAPALLPPYSLETKGRLPLRVSAKCYQGERRSLALKPD